MKISRKGKMIHFTHYILHVQISRKGTAIHFTHYIFTKPYKGKVKHFTSFIILRGETKTYGKTLAHIPFDITRCLLFCLFRLRNTQSWSGKNVFKQRERLGQSEILCVHYYFNAWLPSFCKESNRKNLSAKSNTCIFTSHCFAGFVFL